MRLIYIQLPVFNINDPRDCKNDFDKWIYLLKNMNGLSTFPFSSEVFRRVEEICRVENLQREDRRQYERELKAFRDMNNKYQTAIEEGLREGRARGLEQGKKEGLEQGKAEGREEERIELVCSFYRNGIDVDTIAKATGLSIDRINEILNV